MSRAFFQNFRPRTSGIGFEARSSARADGDKHAPETHHFRLLFDQLIFAAGNHPDKSPRVGPTVNQRVKLPAHSRDFSVLIRHASCSERLLSTPNDNQENEDAARCYLQTPGEQGRCCSGRQPRNGAVTALRLASEVASVVVAAPPGEVDGIAAVVEEITGLGGQAVGATFDAAEDESFAALLDKAAKTFGGIDIFHANFADQSIIFDDSNAIEVDDAVLDRTLEINLKGMARATRHALPRLLSRGGGAMIYSSSAAAPYRRR